MVLKLLCRKGNFGASVAVNGLQRKSIRHPTKDCQKENVNNLNEKNIIFCKVIALNATGDTTAKKPTKPFT